MRERASEAPQPIGENLLDTLCIKYGGQPQGLIMYDDRLKTNIIGEFSVEEFLTEHQSSEPAVRRQYTEVQDIDRVSYRSLYHSFIHSIIYFCDTCIYNIYLWEEITVLLRIHKYLFCFEFSCI